MRARPIDHFVIQPERFIVLFALLACLTHSNALAATFTVNSTGDAGDTSPGDGFCFTGLFIQVPPGFFGPECTLRAAIEEANASSGGDVVEFASSLPTIAGVVEIRPTSSLPAISDPLTIDGYTAPGYDLLDSDARPIVNIGGSQAGPGSGLLVVAGAAGTVLRGLAVHGFDGSGIVLTLGTRSDANVVVEGCHVGISRGVFYVGNGAYGIEVRASRTVRIGKSCAGGICTGRRNVIANSDSHGLRIVASLFVDVYGNVIGTDTFGSSTFVPFGGATPNGGYGITVLGGSRSVIGSTTSGGGNLVSGNELGGVLIDSANSIFMRGNSVGTNLAGTAALANQGVGVEIIDGLANIVGQNVISGNDSGGVLASGANTIELNVIGLTADAMAPLGNGSHGISVDGSGALIEANVIGGNAVHGILTFGDDHRILRNVVGTNGLGDDLGNGLHGIVVSGGAGVEIGAPGLGNIIGFQNFAIGISSATGPNFVRANFIGAAPDGTPIPNTWSSVYVADSSDQEIGGVDGLTNGMGNVIGHNAGSGIALIDNGPADTGNRVQGNWIGVMPDGAPAPNAGGGIRVQDDGNTIGAALSDPDEMVVSKANRIGHNADAAIRVWSTAAGTTTRGNFFVESAEGVPIDLEDDGASDNDFADIDLGANQLQNLPEFDAPQSGWNDLTGELDVRYRVDTDVHAATYPLTIDFYLRTTLDGQTDVYVGSDSYPAAEATLYRTAAITPQSESDLDGLLIATATDAEGNTSELSRQSVPVPEPGLAGMLAAGCALLGVVGGKRGAADPLASGFVSAPRR